MEKVTWFGRALLPALLSLSLLTSGQVAFAQDKMEEAARHFERGLELYGEGALEAALVEFERAYELAPSYKILYNQARIHRLLNQYAEALSEFERYLREGGEEIDPARREEVLKEIEALRPRIATITIRTNVAGADVLVDDVPLGQTPLPSSAVVNPGVRKISVSKPGYLPVSRVVRVVGSDAIQVMLELVPVAGPTRPVERPVDPGPRNRAIIGWVATGVLAGGAVTTGILALNASSSLEEAKLVPNQDPEVLQSEANKLRTFSIIADVCTGAAVVAGGISIYFTVKAVNASNNQKPAGVGFGVGPGEARVFGRF